jgi:nucleoside-diphosphate-sugar epimerase
MAFYQLEIHMRQEALITTMPQKVCITGGSGWPGQEICRLAAKKGYRVVSISRRGRPSIASSWVDTIQWVQSDIFEVENWRDHLEHCHAVIHCIDTSSEQVLQGITYEHSICGATRVVAQAVERAGIPTFVFLSYNTLLEAPSRSIRYIIAKRQAENILIDYNFRYVILRLNHIYGLHRPHTMVRGLWLRFLSTFPPTRAAYSEQRPMHVREVALAALRACEMKQVSGVLIGEKIRHHLVPLLKRPKSASLTC